MKSIRCVRNEEKHMNARHGAGGEASLMAKMEVSRGKVKIRFIVNGNATKSLWGRRLETFQGQIFFIFYCMVSTVDFIVYMESNLNNVCHPDK